MASAPDESGVQRLLLTLLASLAAAALCIAAPAGAVAAPGQHAIGKAKRLEAGHKRGRHLSRKERRRARRLATVSDSVPLTEKAPQQPSDILFQSGFEPAFEGWHVQSLSGRANLVDGSSFSGTANARFEVREGDVEPETGSNRSEVSGPTFNAGQDIYVRDAIRVPSAATYNGSWQIIQQLHETEWGGSPGIAVFLDSDLGLQLGAGDGSPIYWNGPDLHPDRWYDLVYRVSLSQEPSAGFVEVWLDGVQQTLTGGGTRAYGQTIQTSQTYLKAGIYRSRSSSGTSIVEHDNIVVGTSLASVMGP
ncbi:MAG TPA: heparin lyase I family protein [Solirubrobacterales bacterium]|nr:heparin lyase I family protein [Solirubrobacterales bacterium]